MDRQGGGALARAAGFVLTFAVATAAPASAQCPATVCLADGRQALSIADFNAAAPGLPLLQGAPFDESVRGFFDALDAFFLTNQGSFDGFSSAASSAVDRVPVPSGSTSISYRYDDNLETFVRFAAPLAPAISQNARTNGRGVLTIGFAYTELSYDRFEGQDRDGVLFSIFPAPVFNEAAGVPVDFVTHFDFALRQRIYATSVSYGVLDNLDVGVLVPVIDSSFRAIANSRFFAVGPEGQYLPLVIDPATGEFAPDPVIQSTFQDLKHIDRVAFAGGLDRTVFGLTHREDTTDIGDVIVRARYFMGSVDRLDFGAAVNLTTPTGDEDNLLGLDAWRVDPRLLVSTATEKLAGHVNLGYHADTDDADRDRFDYSVGAEGWVTPWLTVLVDHVGRYELRGDQPIRTFEIVPGVKVNPVRDVVLGFNAIMPLNDEGLTSDFVPNFVADVSLTF